MTREGGALGLTDLTSLEDDDTPETIAALCEQAVTPAGHVAAVCVHARFVRQAVSAILETGRLGSAETIHSAAADALDAGADFVETSTGALQPGGTREAARAMLEAIAGAGRGGFKASGGVRGAEDAAAYLALADELLGEGWASPATFRLALGVAGRTAGTGGF
jgi:deoxyribose-phosphate aldolase